MDTPENELPREGRFVIGGKPGPGRPKGSKNKFAEDYWADLHDIWAEHGKSAMLIAIKTDPVKFCAMAAGVLPKDVNVKHEATDAFVNLWKLISDGTAEQAIAKARGEDSSEAVH
jgi:hypothetical protein